MGDAYAPSNPKARSAAELYREASAEQAKAMRLLAGQLREAITDLGRMRAVEQIEMSLLVPALIQVSGVENALLSIANELERAGET